MAISLVLCLSVKSELMVINSQILLDYTSDLGTFCQKMMRVIAERVIFRGGSEISPKNGLR